MKKIQSVKQKKMLEMVIMQKHYVIQKTKELQVFQGETKKIGTQTVKKNKRKCSLTDNRCACTD